MIQNLLFGIVYLKIFWQSLKVIKNQKQRSLILQNSFAQKLHFTNLTSLNIKKYIPATQLEILLTLQIFQKACLWLVLLKNCIFVVLGKQMSGVFPSITLPRVNSVKKLNLLKNYQKLVLKNNQNFLFFIAIFLTQKKHIYTKVKSTPNSLCIS